MGVDEGQNPPHVHTPHSYTQFHRVYSQPNGYDKNWGLEEESKLVPRNRVYYVLNGRI